MAHGHSYARTDDEEREALELAIALSAMDAGEAHQHHEQVPTWYPPVGPCQPSAPSATCPGPSPAAAPAPPLPYAPPTPPALPQQPQQPQRQGSGLLSQLRKLVTAAPTGQSCAGCDAWLGLGPTINAMGRQWHAACFKCAGCGEPIAAAGGGGVTFSVGTEDRLPYHHDCHRRLYHPRCAVCGGFVPERPDGRIEWRESAFWRSRHCPEHDSDGTVSCCACCRLQPRQEEWAPLADGRSLCLDCVSAGVAVDTRDAQPLYQGVLAFFAHQGMPHPYKPPLYLVEPKVLNDYVAKEGGRRDGPIFHIRGLCVAQVYRSIPTIVRIPGAAGGGSSGGFAGALGALLGGAGGSVSSVATQVAGGGGGSGWGLVNERCSVTCILVVYGLPRLLTGSIIAHELMHAYLRMRHVTGLPIQVEEGLCQLMAQLWLDAQDATLAASDAGTGTGRPASYGAVHTAMHQGGGATAPGLGAGEGSWERRLASYLGYQIRTDRSEEYGEGFRTALDGFQARGLRPLVEGVIASRGWPDWVEPRSGSAGGGGGRA